MNSYNLFHELRACNKKDQYVLPALVDYAANSSSLQKA